MLLRRRHDRPAKARPRLRLAAPGHAASTRPASSPTRCCRPTSTRRRKRGELPRACANRLARAKAEAALALVRDDDDLKGAYILAADTVVAVGRRILPKAELLDEAAQCLRLLSGRNHRVYTAICLVTPNEALPPAPGRDAGALQAPVGRGHRGLSRLRRVARQGRRLCRAGHRRHASSSRSSAPIPMSSACRSTRPDAARRARAIRCASAGSTRVPEPAHGPFRAILTADRPDDRTFEALR